MMKVKELDTRELWEASSADAWKQEIVFFAFLCAAAYLGRENPQFAYPGVLWLLATLLGVNVLLHRLYGVWPGASSLVSAGLNSLILAYLLDDSGGRHSVLWPLFLLPIYTVALSIPGWAMRVGGLHVAIVLCFYLEPLQEGDALAAAECGFKAGFLVLSSWVVGRLGSRERSERKLRERRDEQIRFQNALLSEVNDAVIAVDRRGRVVFWNKAAESLYKIASQEAVGRRLKELVRPRWRTAEEERAAAEALESAGVWHGESIHRARGSREIFAESSVSVIRDGLGRANGYLAVIRDVTERRRSEEALRDAERKRAEEALRFSRRVVAAEEAERRRVSRELHDSVNQILSSVKFRIQSLEGALPGRGTAAGEAGRARELLDDAIREIRRISQNLRPTVLDDLGLVAAVRSACEEFRQRTGAAVDLQLAEFPKRLPQETELTLFRIIQEGLTNIEKHARATRVRLSLSREGPRVKVTIQDDGRGFVPDAPPGGKGKRPGLGLLNIRERAASLGGSLDVRSSPRRGTEIAVEVPVSAK